MTDTVTPNDVAPTVAPKAPERKPLPTKVVTLLKYQHTASKLSRARKAKAAAEKRIKRLDAELSAVMGEAADSLTNSDGLEFAKRQYQTRRNVPLDALAARFPDAYAALVTTTTSSWIKTL